MGSGPGAPGADTRGAGPLTWALACVVHAVLVLAPVWVRRDPGLVGSVPILLSILGLSAFLLCDAGVVGGGAELAQEARGPDDRWALRTATLYGLGMLAVIWLAIGEYAARGVGAGSGPEQGVGAVLLLFGVALRLAAIRTLGRGFVSEVTAPPERRLVTTGVYAVVRHPSELANLLTLSGVAVVLDSGLALAGIVAISIPLSLCRMAQEDRLLARALPQEFERYAASVRRLLPIRRSPTRSRDVRGAAGAPSQLPGA